jgi:hypothetical protein
MKVVRRRAVARNAAGMKRLAASMLTVKPSSKIEREAVRKNERLIRTS